MHDTLKDEGANLQQIELGIEILFELGQVVEVRALGGQRGVVSGYFDSHGELAKAIKQLSDTGEYAGVYYALNPCHSDLLARGEKNKWHCGVKETTRDKDIVRRRWLLVDFDPKRPNGLAGASATTAEMLAAKKLMVKVLRELRRLGWPLPVIAFSGNGCHLLFCVDEPNNDETTQLFKGCLKAIAEQFATAEVGIDTTVFNASRITKAYGSLAAKGVDTAERPHRYSKIKHKPAKLCTVSRAQLEALAKTATSTKSTSAKIGNPVQASPVPVERIEEFLKWGEVLVRSSDDYEGGTRWILDECYFNSQHNRGEACVIQYENGALKYNCFHQSCCENTWAEFRAAVEEAKGEMFNFGTRNASTHYRATPAGIVHQFVRNGGRVQKPLTNFTARIVANIEVDDGVETTNNLEIEAVLRNRMRVFSVPSSEFASMNWALQKLGGGAIIAPGAGAKDHARAAIQYLSPDIERRRVFTHTGWRRLGGKWFYLHAAGAIGSDGLYDSVAVKLPPNLAPFCLPEPSTGEELVDAILASLRLLDVAPLSCTLPIYASIWRALLGDSDFSVHATGLTGTYKTSVSALAMQHFGAGFDARHVPGAWSSTANANAALQFVLKDALFLIDDFVPKGSSSDVERQHRDADRIFRGQGNTSGRGRLGRDGTSLREANPPRGLTLSTGEDVPRGQSLHSRFWLVEFSPGDVDVKKLTACQGDASAGIYAQAMSAFLQWFAPRYVDVKKHLPKQIERFRAAAARSGHHARTPEIVANLMVGLNWFLRFAREVGALQTDDAKAIWVNAWSALGKAAAAQTLGQAAEDSAQRFLNLIAAVLDRGDACLREAATGMPSDRERGHCIGWTTDDRVLLEPESAYAAVHQLAAQQGEAFPVRSRTLGKRLEESGLLTHHDKKRNMTQVTIGAARKRVWSIKMSAIFPPLEAQIGDGTEVSLSPEEAI
jgi:hypothetical protein